MIYIAIATLGKEDNVTRLLSPAFWTMGNQIECVYILSQLERIRLNPHRAVTIGYSKEALGCAGARQRMVDFFLAKGAKPDDIIVFLDDDIEILDIHWLEKLIAPLSEGYHLSGVEGRKLTKKLPKVDNKNFDYLSGGWLAANAAVFNYKCRFDMQFNPNYWEDADLSFQAYQHGFKLACVGDIGLRHDETLKQSASELLEINRAKFYKKWGLE